ncbi:MAG: MBL fold metallo-hydrolase [Proteobacteria bacterium]|nr:MBL fold metallo-hydrolase [Pseudomonadota bacterium]
MIQKTFTVGPLQCNCTILACEKTLEAVIIDPGDEPQKIIQHLNQMGVSVKYLLHTHAHFDHIGGTKGVKAHTLAPVCLHSGDQAIYEMLPVQGKMFGMHFESAPPIEKFLQDEETLRFGEHEIQVIHTPGHSPGGVCFKLTGGDETLFSGDSLFQGSIGRTDLWGGDYDQLIKSIKQRLLVLDDDIGVFPGHGPSTLIGKEKRNNPFLT